MEHKSIQMERKWNTNGTQKTVESIVNKGF